MLELTAADELVALENMDVLHQNGFELDIADDRPAGQRVRMTAHPVSGSTTFDAKGEWLHYSSIPLFYALFGNDHTDTHDLDADLEELLHLMHDRPAGQMVRCSKARAMFAMRACRRSVMIGTALNRRQMTSVSFCLLTSTGCYLNSCFHLSSLVGGTTYGYDGPALALSARKTHNAPPLGYCGCRMGSS